MGISCLKRLVILLMSAVVFVPAVMVLSKTAAHAAADSVYSSPFVLVAEIGEREDFFRFGVQNADIVLIHIDSEANVISSDKNTIGNFYDYASSLESIPAFYISDESAVATAISLLGAYPYSFIASEIPGLVKSVRQSCPLSRGIIDFRSDDLSATEIRDTVNRADAKVALVDADCVQRQTFSVLRRLLITVYAEIDTDKSFYDVLTAGGNGVITSDISGAYELLESGNVGSLGAAPLISAHRGLSGEVKENGKAWLENTVSAAKNAYENYGADFVEIDLKLTVDHKVVVMHDDDLTRTTTGTGNIENYTSQQLSSFKVDGGYGDADLEDIPYLEDFFKEFKNTDLYFLLEIKTAKADVVQYTKEIIEEYDMSARVNFIGFSKEQLARVREQMPEISVSLLQYDRDPQSSGYSKAVMDDLFPINADYSPQYSCISSATYKNLAMHAVGVWTWTYTTSSVLTSDVRTMGLSGYTTDFVCFMEEATKRVAPQTSVLGTNEKGALPLTAKIHTYGGEIYEGECTAIKVGGDASLCRTPGGSYYLAGGESCYAVFVYEDPVCGYFLLSESIFLTTENTSANKGCGSSANAEIFISPIGLTGIAVLSVAIKKRCNKPKKYSEKQ